MAGKGRPTRYTKALGERICEKIAEDLTLEEIAQIAGFPSERTILRWAVTKKLPDFCHLYTCAREIQGHVWQERIRSVHKNVRTFHDEHGNERIDPASVQLIKIEAENLKWLASKRLPKILGDKLDTPETDKVKRPILLAPEAKPDRLKPDES